MRAVALGDLGERPLPFGGRGAGALGKDDGDVAVAHVGGQVTERDEFAGRVGCVAVDEVVRHPTADDVEAGVEEQLALQHVAGALTCAGGDHPGAEQRVGKAGVTAQHHGRAGRHRLGAVYGETQPRRGL
jgi:hypothetical protein